MSGVIHCEKCGRHLTDRLVCLPCQTLAEGGDFMAYYSYGSIMGALSRGELTPARATDLILEHRRRTTPRWLRVWQWLDRWLLGG